MPRHSGLLTQEEAQEPGRPAARVLQTRRSGAALSPQPEFLVEGFNGASPDSATLQLRTGWRGLGWGSRPVNTHGKSPDQES